MIIHIIGNEYNMPPNGLTKTSDVRKGQQASGEISIILCRGKLWERKHSVLNTQLLTFWAKSTFKEHFGDIQTARYFSGRISAMSSLL